MYQLILNEETYHDVYCLSDDQIRVVEEAQKQFKNGQFLSGEQADNEIEGWLGK